MQAVGAEGAPSGEDTKEAKEAEDVGAKTNGSPAPKAPDEWGKFYSMPPKWKKDDLPSKSQSGLSDENIGHRLASLLRYHLDDHNGITTDENGWVVASDIVEHADDVGLGGCTVEDLIRVAENNEHSTRGKRFESDGAGRIKATYRHPPKDRRGDRWDSWRDKARQRTTKPRGYNGWHSNGWDDYGKWKDGGWEDDGDYTWTQWKKPGFSPSPDDTIVKESSWAPEKTAEVAVSVKPSDAAAVKSDNKASCDWEQWFTPDSLEMYFYNTQTEEVFFPGDAGDTEEKGWFRYEDTEGEKKGKIYWWHEATSRSFYEEDAIGDESEA